MKDGTLDTAAFMEAYRHRRGLVVDALHAMGLDECRGIVGKRFERSVLDEGRHARHGELVREGAKAGVIACNTATSVAAATLRRELSTST